MSGPGENATARLGLAAFGLSLLTDMSPPGAWQSRPRHEPSLDLRLASPEAIENSWSGLDAPGWQAAIDGAPFIVERGVAGDHRFVHGAHPDQSGRFAAGTCAVHHLNANASVLLCAPRDLADPSWWRLVLDSVLFTVALLRGYEALHAAAIATPAGAVAITAATGGGKSTLLSELLGRGSKLLADDVLVLEPQDAGPPLAYPAPPLMTVPASRIPARREANAGETICSIDDECWIAMPVHPEPLPLKALVVLDRRPRQSPTGMHAALSRIEHPLAPLLEALMSFPRAPERERARFELASALAREVALWRLTAALDTPPHVLADTLLTGIL